MSNALKAAGTRFPFINLQKSIERAKLLFDADQRGRDVTVPAAFAVWGYSEKSSGGFQTIAALISYGLIKDGGDGESRKVALSEEGLRYFRDERPEEKAKLLKVFALKPKLIAALWSEWGASPPADTIARSHLKTEIGLNDQSARSLLAIYKENIDFAKLKGDDKVSVPVSEKPPETPINVRIGDYIQWTSGGQDQFQTPRRVEWISDDRGHLRVFGSMTGIPMTEVAVVDPPKPPPAGATSALSTGILSGAKKGPDINILMAGQRLQITADVDLEGVGKLKEALGKYEELLKMLQ